jgi:hypothetical protein
MVRAPSSLASEHATLSGASAFPREKEEKERRSHMRAQHLASEEEANLLGGESVQAASATVEKLESYEVVIFLGREPAARASHNEKSAVLVRGSGPH